MTQVALLNKKDLKEFSNVVAKIWNNLSKYYSKECILSEKKIFSLKNLKSYYKNNDYLVISAKLDNKIVGVRIAIFEGNTLLLYITGVLSEYQGKGIGTAIHEFTFKHLKFNHPEVHKVWCDTRTSNKEGIAILRKLGFRKCAYLKKHWYNQDYYLWEKFL